MILPENVVIERTDKLSGAGLCRKELGSIKEINSYSTVGVLARIINDELINTLSVNIGSLTQKVMGNSQNEKTCQYSDVAGFLAAEGTKSLLELVKKVAVNTDKMIPLKGIIQLMRYCAEEQPGSFIQDTTVAEIIAALPIKNDKGYHIYVNKLIKSPDEIMKINYSDDELENIGFLLYFMTRAMCSKEELKKCRPRLLQSLSVIGMGNRMQDYESQYLKSVKDKTKQIQETCCSFANMQRSNIKINLKYFSKVVRKMSYYMPADCDIQRQSLLVASQGLDALINKDVNMGINVAGQAMALVIDSCDKSREDYMKQECHKYLVNKEGIEGNTVSEKIEPASEDIGRYYNDLKEEENV